jgi:hypothetical protein
MPKKKKPTKRQFLLSICRFFPLPSSLFPLPSSLLPLLPIVVYHLDSEDNNTTSERDEIGK